MPTEEKNYNFSRKSSVEVHLGSSFCRSSSGSQLITSDCSDRRIKISLNALEITTAPANTDVLLRKKRQQQAACPVARLAAGLDFLQLS